MMHLKSPGNWINDPNGFIYYKGKYHLFYQHFPYAPVWGRMHWGHAVSDDLMNWEHLGIALYPSKLDDRSGCFSGSAVEHNDKMYLFYTGINYEFENPENINLALDDSFIASQMMISSDDGIMFDNIDGKKTVVKPIDNSEIGSRVHARDPKVWRGKDAWYMIIGSTVDNKGRFLFFRSEDLETWDYVNYSDKDNLGWMWECPDYFEIDGKGVVVFSPMGILDDGKDYDSATICALAQFDENTCTLQMGDDYQLFDYGIDLYAPQSTVDEYGNRVIIAWARMPKAVDGKWSGMMCIPRVVEIKNNHIFFRPHPNIKNAYASDMIEAYLSDGEFLDIDGFIIKREGDRIVTDRSKVFINEGNPRLVSKTPHMQCGDKIKLEVFVDSNLIEVYVADGEYVITNVVYM